MPSAPSSNELTSHALRQAAGAALVVLAAAAVHLYGPTDQRWPYVAIAAALVPQILVNLLALHEAARRAALRVTRRPQWLLLLAAAALAVLGPVTWLTGDGLVPALAALSAAAGLAIASAPMTITLAPRQRLT